MALVKGFLSNRKCDKNITHGVHFANGFAVATDCHILAKCRYAYPEAEEGATVNFKTGERMEDRYPDYEAILSPYRETERTVSATPDMKTAEMFINAGKAVTEANGIRNDGVTVSIRFQTEQGDRTAYFPIELCQKFILALKKYGINTIRQKSSSPGAAAYAAAQDGSEFMMMPYCDGGCTCPVDIAGGLNARELRLAELVCMKSLKEAEGAAFQTAGTRRAAKNLEAIRLAKELSGKYAPAPEMTDGRREKVERRIAELEAELEPYEETAPEDPAGDAMSEEVPGDTWTDEEETEDDGTGRVPGQVEATEGADGQEEDPEIRARMLEAIGMNTDRLKKGGDIRPYQIIRTYAMPIEQIGADGAEEYRVYIRPGVGERFKGQQPGICGGQAVEDVRRFVEAKEVPGTAWPGVACQIRHRVKGIVYEWYWGRSTEDGEDTRPNARKKKTAPGMTEEELVRMENLYSFIGHDCGRQAASIVKHMKNCGIRGWEDLTRAGMYRLRDEFRQTCAPASARTYMATVKGFLARYEDERGISPEYRDILRNKADKPVKTWLDKEELSMLEGVEPLTETERLVKTRFLIGAYTGMRISDAMQVSETNERDGMLSYVAQKTGAEATVPCPEKVRALIADAQANDRDISLMAYNRTLRGLCKRAGICRAVKTHRGGETREGPKWMFVSSHTARISFATNLANLGVPLIKLAGMMGHSSTQMTERYIAGKTVSLSSKAMTYFE